MKSIKDGLGGCKQLSVEQRASKMGLVGANS